MATASSYNSPINTLMEFGTPSASIVSWLTQPLLAASCFGQTKTPHMTVVSANGVVSTSLLSGTLDTSAVAFAATNYSTLCALLAKAGLKTVSRGPKGGTIGFFTGGSSGFNRAYYFVALLPGEILSKASTKKGSFTIVQKPSITLKALLSFLQTSAPATSGSNSSSSSSNST